MDSVILTKINSGLKATNVAVYPMSSSDKLDKFSVLASNGHQFVHVFEDNKAGLVYVNCESGLCMNVHRKKVKLQSLDTASRCPHLDVFKD